MNQRIISVLILFMLCALPVFSQHGSSSSAVSVDTRLMQRYKGYTGKWVQATSSSELIKVIRRFGSSLWRVKQLNGNIDYSSHIFVPYSSKVIKMLQKKHASSQSCSREGLIWPIHNAHSLTSSFGIRMGRLHAGIDIPAPKGTPVIAALDGRVVYAGFAGGYGNSVMIEHRNGYRTRYSHNTALLVKKGDLVRQGQIIAKVGSTGHSTGPHLDFEIRYRNIPLNPMDFLPNAEAIHVQYNHLKGLKKVKSAKQLRSYH